MQQQQTYKNKKFAEPIQKQFIYSPETLKIPILKKAKIFKRTKGNKDNYFHIKKSVPLIRYGLKKIVKNYFIKVPKDSTKNIEEIQKSTEIRYEIPTKISKQYLAS